MQFGPYYRFFIIIFLSQLPVSRGFLSQPPTSTSRRCPALSAKLFPSKDKNSESMDFSQFNPLDRSSIGKNTLYSYASASQVVSLRKTQMQQLVNQLLNLVHDTAQMQKILASYKDFLLEPLEDPLDLPSYVLDRQGPTTVDRDVGCTNWDHWKTY